MQLTKEETATNLNKKVGVMFVMVLLLSVFPVRSSDEFQITKNQSSQHHPRIYKDTVVWHDYRNGNWNIYKYNLSTGQELQLTTEADPQLFPAVYEDMVVWYGYGENPNWLHTWNIYGYNLSTGEYFLKKELLMRDRDIYNKTEFYTAIYENFVVWQDRLDQYYGWNIYGYNLSTGQEFQITTNRRNQENPAIHGNIVVWQDWRNENWDIFRWDVSTGDPGKMLQTTMNKKDQILPAIYGDIIVWQDNRNGDWDIYGYRISKDEEFQITTNRSDQIYPAIYENIVIYEDNRNGNQDIYGYNLSIGQEFQITTNPSDQLRPEIHSNIVVWDDRRNANGDEIINSDIYGCNISNLDKDNDGYSVLDDCNDNDPGIHPGAQEVCDGKDNDCDGETDEGCDKDNDGYTTYEGDCNDNDPSINPGVSEICNDNKDNDCDGYIDCSDSECGVSDYCDHDKDNDGYDGTAYGGNDCNDNDPSIHPRAQEICDGKDNDCDGETDEGCDKDNDGYTTYEGDCNDNDPSIHPGAQEVCDDNKDNNCDGDIDCSDSECINNNNCISKGHLLISVLDPKGMGLKAKVYVNGSYKDDTNSKGNLTIYNLEADEEYTIKVKVQGYEPEERTVEISKDITEKLEIEMKKEDSIGKYILAGLLFIFLILVSVFKFRYKKKSKKTTTPKSASLKPSSTNILYCPYCRKKIEESRVTCPYCGANLDDTQRYSDRTRTY